MREHVCARCGDLALLFPAENIGAIEPVSSHARFCAWTERPRRSGAEPVLDVRQLLDVITSRPRDVVILRWRSTDGARRLALLLDAVEGIVHCYAGDLIDVPILPRRLRPLCDQVMHDPSGHLRLRVKPDVELPLQRPGDRRRYVRSLVTMDGVR